MEVEDARGVYMGIDIEHRATTSARASADINCFRSRVRRGVSFVGRVLIESPGVCL